MKSKMVRFPYAGLKMRAAAMALDFLIVIGYAVFLAVVATILFRMISAGRVMDSAWTRDGVAFFTLILPTILYFSLQESSSRQATYGKRKMGLKVIDRKGRRLSAGRALLRSGLKFLPWQMAHTAVFQIWDGNTSAFLFAVSLLAQIMVILFVLTLMMNKQHRTLYDRLAGSAVIMAEGSPQPSPL
jgi:uncharacterized RDD family membrane protein YckC